MSLVDEYRFYGKIIVDFFRWDLQLHFFWGFFLTLLGVYWMPLYFSSVIVTLVKEALDVWSKGYWCWGDFWCGIIGSALAIVYLQTMH